MKVLKTMKIDDTLLQPIILENYMNNNYNTNNNTTTHNNGLVYDNSDTPSDYFDRFSLEKLLCNFMDTDPATRFAIARNVFEQGKSILLFF